MYHEDILRVFLEPAEWDELQGSRPVIQLNVSIQHYIGESATDGQMAVKRSNLPCMSSFPTLSAIVFTHQLCIVGTVFWSVSKSTSDPDVVLDNFAGARKRASFPYFLPKGVTLPQMEKFWRELQFNPVAPVEVPFRVELFRSPPGNIRRLRKLARQGRRRLKRSLRNQKGKPTLVLGIPNDARKVAPLLALAHGPGMVPSVAKRRRLRRKGRPVRSSSMRSANTSENQERSTREANSPLTATPIDTSSQPRRTTEQTTQAHAVPDSKPLAQETPRATATLSQRQNQSIRKK